MTATITIEKKSGKWIKRRVEIPLVTNETSQECLDRARAAYVKKWGEPKALERIVSINV